MAIVSKVLSYLRKNVGVFGIEGSSDLLTPEQLVVSFSLLVMCYSSL